MAHGFSKQNQSIAENAFRFGEFELDPRDRRLTRAGISVSLQPKAFDALMCLVRRAGHLVSKQELTNALWPSVYVSEANLTNVIVQLRKTLGRDAIKTVSKHGYRFELGVHGEPGVARSTYERFVRAKELTVYRSLDSMHSARDLYWICLAESPTFAPAWAWLGRCCWFLAKFSKNSSVNRELAQEALKRAFAIDPDLACAHQFYTVLEVDGGNAGEAVRRLLDRLRAHPGEPESYVGLVHAFRFLGLLELSVESHKRAVALDPTVVTSFPHTLFLAGEFDSAIDAYRGRATYYLDAAARAALGEGDRAAALLRERLEHMSLSNLMSALLQSLLDVLENRTEQAVRQMQQTDASLDPEILLYFGRHYSRIGEAQRATETIKKAETLGFTCAPSTLKFDPWLSGVREHPGFRSILLAAETLTASAQLSFGARMWNDASFGDIDR
jgi:DNA-binding winged helix-turn-helix (wHTH) protein